MQPGAPEEATMEDDTELYPWETDGDLPWLEHATLPWESNDLAEELDELEIDDAELDDAEPWQCEEGTPGWPEECAGPEYWLYKDMLD
jgi:hypothetical protein